MPALAQDDFLFDLGLVKEVERAGVTLTYKEKGYPLGGLAQFLQECPN